MKISSAPSGGRFTSLKPESDELEAELNQKRSNAIQPNLVQMNQKRELSELHIHQPVAAGTGASRNEIALIDPDPTVFPKSFPQVVIQNGLRV